jgi:hypothetical protein
LLDEGKQVSTEATVSVADRRRSRPATAFAHIVPPMLEIGATGRSDRLCPDKALSISWRVTRERPPPEASWRPAEVGCHRFAKAARVP